MDPKGNRKIRSPWAQARFWAPTTALLACGLVLSATAGASRPPIAEDHISYGGERRAQMAAYSRRHYGEEKWRLRDPDAIVLHFTGGPSYSSAWNTFESNAPNLGESPGVCAHYVIKQSGTIAEVVPPRIRCRHTIGLNHRSIGIEMVQETGSGAAWADAQILDRRRQVGAALRLVRWLQERYGIATGDVIGHSMANDSPYFKDLQGWRNDHSDWLERDVREFRRRLRD
jgi:N-acetyl-anhydromuramyl-L-alanine amidase AmpD